MSLLSQSQITSLAKTLQKLLRQDAQAKKGATGIAVTIDGVTQEFPKTVTVQRQERTIS